VTGASGGAIRSPDDKIPEGKFSVRGVGKTEVGEYEILNDYLKCPVGGLRSSGVEDTSLLYNEFIVYDVDQVKMKYLVKLKFNEKSGDDDLW
jgi:poly [ADP-ribose] polymerase